MNTVEPNNSIVIYLTNDGETSIDVKFQNETVWLSQAQMAELIQKDRTVIGRHINNIFKEGELDESLVCAKFAHTKEISLLLNAPIHWFSLSGIYSPNQTELIAIVHDGAKCG